MRINNLNEPLETKLKKIVKDNRAGQTKPAGYKVFNIGTGLGFRSEGGTDEDGEPDFKVTSITGDWVESVDNILKDAGGALGQSAAKLDAVERRLNDLNQVVIDTKAGNIDVPGTLAAKLVQAMDIETKRLIVTEEALLNNATVIGRMVANEFDAKTVSSERLDALEGRFQSLVTGDLTVKGRFQSGDNGQPSVVIPSTRVLTSGMQQVAVWFSHNGRDTTLEDGAPTAGLWVDTNSEMPTSLNLRGRAGGGVKIFDRLLLTDSLGQGSGRIDGQLHVKISSGRHKDGWWGDVTLKSDQIRIEPSTGSGGYRNSWGGGGLRPVQMGQSSGILYTETSSRRVKQDIESAEADDAWLDLRTVTYRERRAVGIGEAVRQKTIADPDYKPTPEEEDVLRHADTHFTGRIAEELHDAGYKDQVIYDVHGRPDGVDYARDGAKLIPHVRRNRDEIRELKALIKELQEKVGL